MELGREVFNFSTLEPEVFLPSGEKMGRRFYLLQLRSEMKKRWDRGTMAFINEVQGNAPLVEVLLRKGGDDLFCTECLNHNIFYIGVPGIFKWFFKRLCDPVEEHMMHILTMKYGSERLVCENFETELIFHSE